ncbi:MULTISPECIES: PQQ-dependent sugar dehydrogenase [Alteromonas]|jgi:glucose/arabinose dehydrogenase|uniref:PQQ-dependent sugar dehydrogenase n=1 Tax=Alteromonas stellipolaris TaxID=233316 RepID=A0AAW7Z5S9_9ALTE|nr:MULTISPECIES: PQQ-dependent sugar dehydrogenase [Alteromonas]AMJ87739.1 glucose dehydrogenase [Alteromonas sp. Mac1]AMJ91603.1 glucose dehydrogenase [Alteromonas sp. Mac2]ANB21547.1 glucose dehydrogenase [Alteromonas stellipolaris]MDO6579170.1 PQQ-dependent sugar dehydrogenase [Alteromonas stellipolaris]
MRKRITRQKITLLITMLATSFVALAQSDLPVKVEMKGSKGTIIVGEAIASFNNPWAMAFLPDGHSLVTEKAGTLWLLDKSQQKRFAVTGTPDVTARGQGGLGDVIVHPDFKTNSTIYISYIERDPKDDPYSGAVIERATLTISDSGANLSDRELIWHQSPKVTGNGHYSHRMVISPDGYLFITSGDRQKFTPAQNMAMNLGKILRLNADGSVPQDNPFYGNGSVTEQIWTLGHRNPLGIDFDEQGNLWSHEMGPRHGDELNVIEKARNYGYPIVSQGDHYSGVKIPNHEEFPIYKAPVNAWVPAISPAGFIIYKGDLHKDWKGNGFIGGLSSEALVRVTFSQDGQKWSVEEAERYEWGKRVREVEQDDMGNIYVLEDKEGGRLIKLQPSN